MVRQINKATSTDRKIITGKGIKKKLGNVVITRTQCIASTAMD
jgi:hypothetical protein